MHLLNKIQLALVSYFLIVVAAVHIANPGINWQQIMVSNYVLGFGGTLLMLGLVALGFTQIFVGYEHRNQKVPAIFFFLAGFGVLLAAFFPVNLADLWSPISTVHMVGAIMQFFFFPLALITFKHNHGFLHTYTRVTGWLALCLLFILAFSGLPLGIVQRIIILFTVIWFYVSALNPAGDLYE